MFSLMRWCGDFGDGSFGNGGGVIAMVRMAVAVVVVVAVEAAAEVTMKP